MWVAFERLCKISSGIDAEAIFSKKVHPNCYGTKLKSSSIVPIIKMDISKMDEKASKQKDSHLNSDDHPQKSSFNSLSLLQQSNHNTSKTKGMKFSHSKEKIQSNILSQNMEEYSSTVSDMKRLKIRDSRLKNTSEMKIDDIMNIMKVIGTAYSLQYSYRSEEALSVYNCLPKNILHIGRIMSNIGRCLFETVKYTEAEKIFSEMLKYSPTQIEGIEYYSTCLWHLKKQSRLCWLSNYLIELWQYAPETWITVGNCFSLLKEHETAIKFFQRAIHLDPYFSYAYTLCGHEYVANEDFESGKACYNKAMTVDEKHYNAWWGFGNVCMKQEKYDEAIKYFDSATRLNKESAVLFTYLGMAYFNKNDVKEAMNSFRKAESIDPKNPLTKFQIALVLISINEQKKALDLLVQLSQIAPKEAPIHVLIGKLYKEQGNKEWALKHWNIALDLDPKNAASTKLLIDSLSSETEESKGDIACTDT